MNEDGVALRDMYIGPSDVTLHQWAGLYPCRLAPSFATKQEYGLNTRGYYCFLPRQGYLFLVVQSVLEHFFGRSGLVAGRRLVFEIPPNSINNNNNNNNKSWAGQVSAYYPVGVLADIFGADPPGGLLSLEFTLLPPASTASSSFLNYSPWTHTVEQAASHGFLTLAQQQKAACSAVFGTTAPLLKIPPKVFQSLRDAVAHNDMRAFYAAKEIVWMQGERERLTARVPEGMGVFIFHESYKNYNNSSENIKGGHTLRCISTISIPTLGALLREFIPGYTKLFDDNNNNNSVPLVRAIITGVEPLLSTPTRFLLHNMCCADFCVHITIVRHVA